MSATVTLFATLVSFNPNQNIEVKAPVMHIECSRECTVLESAQCVGTMNTHTCDDFKVNGIKVAGYAYRHQLVRSGKNEFQLPALKADYKATKNARICVRLETNLYGSELENEYDSSSILSYCTNKTSSWENRPQDVKYKIWNNRRVETLQELMSSLERAIDVRLK